MLHAQVPQASKEGVTSIIIGSSFSPQNAVAIPFTYIDTNKPELPYTSPTWSYSDGGQMVTIFLSKLPSSIPQNEYYVNVQGSLNSVLLNYSSFTVGSVGSIVGKITFTLPACQPGPVSVSVKAAQKVSNTLILQCRAIPTTPPLFDSFKRENQCTKQEFIQVKLKNFRVVSGPSEVALSFAQNTNVSASTIPNFMVMSDLSNTFMQFPYDATQYSSGNVKVWATRQPNFMIALSTPCVVQQAITLSYVIPSWV